jgi:hypothetical protein
MKFDKKKKRKGSNKNGIALKIHKNKNIQRSSSTRTSRPKRNPTKTHVNGISISIKNGEKSNNIKIITSKPINATNTSIFNLKKNLLHNHNNIPQIQ